MKSDKIKIRGMIAFFLTAVLITGLTACGSGIKEGASSVETRSEKAQEAVNISILCVGDIMAHSPNIAAAKNAAGGSGYDFTGSYEYVKPYIENADLALCNVETTFSGGTPSGYPLFCAPDELSYAIMDAGFDVGITSNNHMMDTGFDGMQRTLEILRNQGLVTVGSRYAGEDTWAVTETKGLKIGLVAYTYETTGPNDNSVSINGNFVSKEAAELINSFNYNEMDEDLRRIGDDIQSVKKAGADLVICYFHWGNEYQRDPDSYQLSMAQAVADAGADVIFASHPHVLQKADVLKSSDGKNVPVFYSMGNFISNQRSETLGSISNSRYTEQGMMAQVDISLMKSTDEIIAEKVKVVPTWLDRYGSPLRYSIVPLDENLTSNAALASSGHLARAQEALDDATALLGSEYLGGKDVLAVE